MQFTTKITIEKFQNPITYESKIMALGSCFAENMSEKFDYFKFQNTTNPFGIIFNPVSIEKLVNRIVNKIEFTEKDIFFHNDLWHCYEVHSELSNPNKEEFLKELNLLLFQSFNSLIQTTHIIITYGTSWVYRNIESKEIVANCQKVPQKQFSKELLPIETIEKSIQNTIALLQKITPSCNFIFTVSPVRHIKDGFIENQRSKSHLISAIHSNNQQPTTNNYFPSYEIMMDELRDYRFYAEDMLHPNQVAIDYIWECFSENYISDESQQVMVEVDSIQKSLLHRSFNPNSERHQKFLENLQQKINTLALKLPHITF
ncbi:GSCFA domain-containing protein [uncultured Flavobacterium sp.]|uniref:GSCFA domain-containing protein n=1 Tax=uncultured Flavobacterium sp. TaxID=165435 RepID=UPI0030ECAA38